MCRTNISNSYYLFGLLTSVFTVSYTSETPDQYPGLEISHGLLWWIWWVLSVGKETETTDQHYAETINIYCEVTPGSLTWDMCWCLSVIINCRKSYIKKNLYDVMLDNNSECQVCLFFSELLFGSLKIWHHFRNIAVLSGVGMTLCFF